ncbi:MAG: DUF2721 domain-containing protein [Prochlorococcus sp.]
MAMDLNSITAWLLAARHAPATELGQAIELSVAPVFLLVGIGGFLNVISGRLARIIDRSSQLYSELDIGDPVIPAARINSELKIYRQRMLLSQRAIECLTLLIMLIAFVVAMLFVSVMAKMDLKHIVVPAFVVSMICLMTSSLLFMKEVQLAIAQNRRLY